MDTCTNAKPVTPQSADELLSAMEAAKRELYWLQPLPNEYRLHPADLAELEAEASRMGHMLTSAPPSVFGVRIIPDPDAPRLPRKVTSR